MRDANLFPVHDSILLFCSTLLKYCIVLTVFVLEIGTIEELLQAVDLHVVCRLWLLHLCVFVYSASQFCAELVCVDASEHPTAGLYVLIRATETPCPPQRQESLLTLCPSYRRLLFIL